jgi:putative chitinase
MSLGAGKVAPGEDDNSSSEELIAQDDLKALFPQAPDAYLKQIVDELNTDLPAYGLETVLRQAHFFGQIMQEAGPRIQAKVEDLEYSPAALMKFGYYKLHPDEAKTDGYTKVNGVKTKKADHKAIANKAYGRADLGNGGPETGDGYKYRGRGLFQVTGKYNYKVVTEKYHDLYEDDTIDFVNKPDLVMEFPYTLRSAICYWLINKLPSLADRGKLPQDVDRITKVVNAKTDSYNARQKNFAAALDAFT